MANKPAKNRQTTRVAPARWVAVTLLGEQRRREAHARDLLRGSYRMKSLSARDRAFTTRLVLGVVGTSGALDAVLNGHLRRAGGLEPKVRDCLRLSAYEMLYLGTDPAIAVSQGVELVRRASQRAAGLANAVLHRVAEEDVPALRETEDRVRVAARGAAKEGSAEQATTQDSTSQGAPTPVSDAEVTAEDLAFVAGVPSWIAEGVLEAYGVSPAAAWALMQREPAGVCVANNLHAQSDATCLNVLKSRDFKPTETGLVGSWQLGKPAHLAKSGLVDEVRVLPADSSTQLVARVATPRPGQTMLEVGQGRGTKSILALNNTLRMIGDTTSAEETRLVGIDSEDFKCEISDARLRQAGWGAQAQSICVDARTLDKPDQLPERLRGFFDLVLVDAPCSGVGTLRRHPEIAWSLERQALAWEGERSLPTLQLELLRAAASRVAPGGTLVYTTCSFMAVEDEDVVERFLSTSEGASFSVVSAAEAPAVAAIARQDAGDTGYKILSQDVTADGFVRIRPRQGFDQHFCARLVRKG